MIRKYLVVANSNQDGKGFTASEFQIIIIGGPGLQNLNCSFVVPIAVKYLALNVCA